MESSGKCRIVPGSQEVIGPEKLSKDTRKFFGIRFRYAPPPPSFAKTSEGFFMTYHVYSMVL